MATNSVTSPKPNVPGKALPPVPPGKPKPKDAQPIQQVASPIIANISSPVQKSLPPLPPTTRLSQDKPPVKQKRTERQLKQPRVDVRSKYAEILDDAHKQKNFALLATSLIDMSRELIELEDWAEAAKFLNAALVYSQNDTCKNTILSQMAELEKRFLEEECQITSPSVSTSETLFQQRAELKALREKMRQRLPAQTILRDFSQGICDLVDNILKDIYKLIGAPPCEFTLLSLGSLARKEMSPFSDLECALLIPTPENAAYFRKLIKLLEIRVIHFGETVVDIPRKRDGIPIEPIQGGFSFDVGGNTPLNVELLTTPSKLALYQTEEKFDSEVVQSVALRCPGIILGSQELFTQYQIEMRKILSARPSPESVLTISQKRDFAELEKTLQSFPIELNKEKQKEPLFDIKMELYRPLNFTIMSLSNYYGIETSNSWDKLDQLCQKGVLNTEGIENLKWALGSTMSLRMRCHLFHGKECDKAYHPSLQGINVNHAEASKGAFVLTPDDIATISKIYTVQDQLYKAIRRVCELRSFSELAKETFAVTEFEKLGDASTQNEKFEDAKGYYSKALAVNPDDTTLQIKLAETHLIQLNFKEAKEYANKALQYGTQRQNKRIIARAYQTLARIEIALCHSQASVEFLMKALDLNVSNKLEEASIHFDLGRAWMCEHVHPEVLRKNFETEEKKIIDPLREWWGECLQYHVYQAIEHYNKALVIYNKTGEHQGIVASILAELAHASLFIPTLSKQVASTFLEEALNIGQKAFRKQGLKWADILYIAACFDEVEGGKRHAESMKPESHRWTPEFWSSKEADKKHKEALRIYTLAFGKENPHTAAFKIMKGERLSLAFAITKKLDAALKILRKVYGETYHSYPAANLRLLTLHDKQNADKLVEAVKIIKQSYGSEHPKVVYYLKTLVGKWNILQKTMQAKACMEEIEKICSSQGYAQATKHGAYVPETDEMKNNRRETHQKAVSVLSEIIRPNFKSKEDATNAILPYLFRMPNHPVQGAIPYTQKNLSLTEEIIKRYIKVIFDENPQYFILNLEEFRTFDEDDVIALLKDTPQIGEVIVSNGNQAPIDLSGKLQQIKALDTNVRKLKVTLLGDQTALSEPAQLLERYFIEADGDKPIPKYNLGLCYEFGKGGMKKSDEEAIYWYMQAAELGDHDAQYKVGVFYRHGRGGLKQSDEDAVKWYMKSADQGNTGAQNNLALMYEKGLGKLAPSLEMAKQLFEKAANQGDESAAKNLERLNKKGNIRELSDAETVANLQRDALKGDPKAQYDLGIMYQYGRRNLPKSEKQAAEWFMKSAEKGYPSALVSLGNMYTNGTGGLPRSVKLATKCYEEGARTGNAVAQYNLANYYAKSIGELETKEAQAVDLYKKSADQGDEDAMNALGLMYEDGRGVDKSIEKAKEYYQIALSKGCKNAQQNLDRLNKGEPSQYVTNTIKFQELLKKAEAEDATAQFELGLKYKDGTGGLPTLQEKALKWFEKSAAQENGNAQNSLGIMYELGTDVTKKSEQRALEFYGKAARNGNTIAQNNLERLNKKVNPSSADTVSTTITTQSSSSNAEYVAKLQKDAFGGNAKAQYDLGVIYQYGNRGIVKNEVTAVEWYRKSVAQNYAPAQCNLGFMYRKGLGDLPKSDKDAVDLYIKSADQNNRDAQNNLGFMYENGHGIGKSTEKALEYYEKAAEQGSTLAAENLKRLKEQLDNTPEKFSKLKEDANAGDREAQNELGLSYEFGRYGLVKSEATALEWYLKSANQGYSIAQYNVGNMHRNGRGGLSKSDEEAYKWYKMSADQGYRSGQYMIGFFYRSGLGGLPKSDEEAHKWYTKAADQGYADAQLGLGYLYANGLGVKKSDEQAIEWYKKSADQGNAQAQNNLGFMYENGRGGLQSSLEKAKELYESAAKKGNELAKTNLEKIIEKMSERKNDADELIKMQKDAERGDATAQNELGVAYQDGTHGLNKNHATAVEWYRKAALQGHVLAEYNLGRMYRNGWGVPKSDEEAVVWFTKAANKNDHDAQHILGFMYEDGVGKLPKSEKKALEWYLKAAAQGNTLSMHNIGRMYRDGAGGLKSSDVEAAKWWIKSAAAGVPQSQTGLGTMYLYGRGNLPKDEKKALELFKQASEKNEPVALFNMGLIHFEGKCNLPKSTEEAKKYWTRAAKLGNVDAEKRLKKLNS